MSNRSAQAIGEIIRQQRELAELSMRQFAELAGISNPYLSQIERGLRAPSEQVVQAIADALKISADSLYEQAGLGDEADAEPEVVQAIREDPKLTARQRQALIEIYESFAGPTPRRRRRAKHDGSQSDARSPASCFRDMDTRLFKIEILLVILPVLQGIIVIIMGHNPYFL